MNQHYFNHANDCETDKFNPWKIYSKNRHGPEYALAGYFWPIKKPNDDASNFDWKYDYKQAN